MSRSAIQTLQFLKTAPGFERSLALLATLVVGALLIMVASERPRAFAAGVDSNDLYLPRSGTYPVERSKSGALPFQWTDAHSVYQIANPGGPLQVTLVLLGRPPDPTPITLRAEQTAMQFAVQPGQRVYSIMVPPVAGERVRLSFDMPTEHIAERDLGIAVSGVAVAGGAGIPQTLVVTLIAATLMAYVQWRRHVLLVMSGVLLAQIAALWWWASGGWSYSLLGVAIGVLDVALLTTLSIESHIPYSLLLPARSRNSGILRQVARLVGTSLALIAALALMVDRDILPFTEVIGFAVATVGVYTLLRQAGVSASYAVVGVAIVFFALVAVHGVLGWDSGQVGKIALVGGGLAAGAALIERWLPRQGLVRPRRVGWARQDILIAVALAAGALAIRLLWAGAPDPVGDIELAARRMGLLQAGGLANAYTYEGDYMPLWMYIVYALSYLVQPLGGAFFEPIPAITRVIVKSPSIVADVATAVLMFAWGRQRAPRTEAALIAALYTLSPPVWINSSWWGQADTLLMLPLVGSLMLLDRGRGRWSWLLWAVAQATKPQAIVFLPVVAVATLRRYGSRVVVEGIVIAAATIALAAAPLVLAGQGNELWYASATSVGRFPRVSAGAFNLGFLLTGGERTADTALWLGLLPYRALGLLLLSSAALVICIGLVRRTDTLACCNAAAALALAFFYLPTQIHERYLFLPLASLALCMIMSRTFLPVFLVLMVSATLNIFGDLRGFFPAVTAAIKATPLPEVLAVMNGLVLVVLVLKLYRDTPRAQRQQSEPPAD